MYVCVNVNLRTKVFCKEGCRKEFWRAVKNKWCVRGAKMQEHGVLSCWGLLKECDSSTSMISDTNKRSVDWMWILLAALFACAQFLECARAAQEDSQAVQAVQVKIDPEKREIDMDINRCILHNPNTTPNNTKYIAELHTRFNSLREEQKTHAYEVNVTNKSEECSSGCCEELIVHLVQQLAEVDGLCVSTLDVKNYCAASTSRPDAPVFTDRPGPPLVVQTMAVQGMSSVCFHGVCSAVQVCMANNVGGQSMVKVTNVACIDFARHPLACAWKVRSIVIEGASTVDLGPSVHRLAREAKAEESAAPGFWVRDRVMIGSSYNCCMTGSTVDFIEQGVPVETRTEFFGIAVAEGTAEAELASAVYRAVCAVRKVKAGQHTQRYVMVPHEAYKQKDLEALARQLNVLIKKSLGQQTDKELSQVVDLQAAPRDEAPFMCVGVGKSHEAVSVSWVVRVEKEVLASSEKRAKAAEELTRRTKNMDVMKGVAALKSIEDALRRYSSRADSITGGGMTLLPCGCFEESVLNEVCGRGASSCLPEAHAPRQGFSRITISCQKSGYVSMEITRAVPMDEAQNPSAQDLESEPEEGGYWIQEVFRRFLRWIKQVFRKVFG